MLEETQTNLREQGIGENVINAPFTTGKRDAFLYGEGFQLSIQRFELGLKEVGGSAGDRLCAIEDPGL